MKIFWFAILVNSCCKALIIQRVISDLGPASPMPRSLNKDKDVYETSGSIKIGLGDDFDRNGQKVSSSSSGKGPKMPAKIEMSYPEITDPADNQVAYASFPNYVMAPARKQKPIVFVPEIIYPNIKKRVFVHHYDASRMYRDMLMSPTYLSHLAMKNPEYSKFFTEKLKKDFNKYPYFKTYKPKKPIKAATLLKP